MIVGDITYETSKRSQKETQFLVIGKCMRESATVVVVVAAEDISVIALCTLKSCNHLRFVHICKKNICKINKIFKTFTRHYQNVEDLNMKEIL